MDNNQKILIELLSLSLRGEKASRELMNSADWISLFQLARIHSVLPLIYTALDHQWIDQYILDDFKTAVCKQALIQYKNLNILEKVIDWFQESNIPLLALKGIVLRDLYPVPETRTMSDFDLAVPESNFNDAVRILSEIGFVRKGHNGNAHIQMEYGDSLVLELHRRLFDKEKNLPCDYMNKVWKNAIPVLIIRKTVLTCSDDDNMLYLCLHLAKHFKEEGFGLRQLCDIVLFVRAGYDNIDWEAFYNRAIQSKVSKFVLMVFTICNQLFNLRIPEYLQQKNIQENKWVELFIQDILEGGTFGMESSTRRTGNRLINKMGNWDLNGFNKFRGIIKFLFPIPDQLGARYFYIKKYPVLLPLAWVHRWVFNFTSNDQREMIKVLLKKESSKNSFETVRIRREIVNWLMNEE